MVDHDWTRPSYDRNAATGCEANLPTSPTYCAACGTVCPAVTNGVPARTAGVIGFAFNATGISATAFRADTHGNLLLGTTGGSSSLTNACPLTGASRAFTIAPLWGDMNLNRVLTPAGRHRICTVNTGSAPSRQWAVTWEEVPFYSSTITTAATFSAVMSEATSAITFQWATGCVSTSATIGVQGATTAQSTTVGTCNVAQSLNGNQVTLTLVP